MLNELGPYLADFENESADQAADQLGNVADDITAVSTDLRTVASFYLRDLAG
jgi:hypothetical protein